MKYKMSKYTGIFAFIAVALVSAFALSGCGLNQKPLSKTDFMLGTVCTLTVYDGNKQAVIDASFKEIKRLERLLTVKNAVTSEIIKLNESAGSGKWVKLSDESYSVVKKALFYSRLSGGLFDPSIGPLVEKWGIGTEAEKIPSKQEIKDALSKVDYRNIKVDDAKKSVMLVEPGMELDLGGVAKGYAGDRVKNLMIEMGVKHAIINLGGNIVLVGSNVDGEPWKVGVQDPNLPNGSYMAVIKAADESIISSGIYERYFEKDGKRYHHILDPRTGYPADTGLLGVTIVSANEEYGDGLTSSLFLLGAEEGMKLLGSLKGVEGLFITTDKKVYVTPGLKSKLEVTSSDYKLAN